MATITTLQAISLVDLCDSGKASHIDWQVLAMLAEEFCGAEPPCLDDIREAVVSDECRRIEQGDFAAASHLWDAVDHARSPEPLWGIMQAALPWAFNDERDANTIIRPCPQFAN